jgi:hypothetical protein
MFLFLLSDLIPEFKYAVFELHPEPFLRLPANVNCLGLAITTVLAAQVRSVDLDEHRIGVEGVRRI